MKDYTIPTLHPQGYTPEEIERILVSDDTINTRKFYKKLNRNNCTVLDGDIVIYRESVELAFRYAKKV